MVDDAATTPVSLASAARALWALNHDSDPEWFALASKQEKAEYEAMAERFLRLAAG